MNPFRYPEVRHLRSQSPGPFADYKRYKPFLRTEFRRQCVYCRMPDGIRGEFGVDHYRPASKFPELRCDYTNLFYACNACNSRKGSFWPSERQLAEGLFVPNPCDHAMADHLSYRGVLPEARSRAGQIAIEILLLDDEDDMRYRAFVMRSIERCVQTAERLLKTLADLEVRIPGSFGQARQEMERDFRSLQGSFAQVQEDLERLSGSRL